MLKGKNAIITGARRGIGRATVEKFAQNGANVWACARKYDENFENDMRSIADKYNVSVYTVYFDVTDEAEIKAAINTIRASKLSIDVLVNVAGIAEESSSFLMTSKEKIQKTLEVNYLSVAMITQYVARIMIRQKQGTIVNVSSIAGMDGAPGQFEYVGSKAAIIGITKELAKEFAQYGIRVNAIAPGIVDTDMGNQIEPSLKEEIVNRVFLKRTGKAEEIAAVIAFLSSDYASYVNGQTIRVDGGM